MAIKIVRLPKRMGRRCPQSCCRSVSTEWIHERNQYGIQSNNSMGKITQSTDVVCLPFGTVKNRTNEMNANQIHAKSSAFFFIYIFILKVFSRSHMFAHAFLFLFSSVYRFCLHSSAFWFLFSFYSGGWADWLPSPMYSKNTRTQENKHKFEHTRVCNVPVSRLAKIHFISFCSVRPTTSWLWIRFEWRKKKRKWNEKRILFWCRHIHPSEDERRAWRKKTFLNKKRRRKDDSMKKKKLTERRNEAASHFWDDEWLFIYYLFTASDVDHLAPRAGEQSRSRTNV